MYLEMEDASPAWLVLHPFGHGYGPVEATEVVDLAVAAIMDTVLPVGSYAMVGGVLAPDFDGP